MTILLLTCEHASNAIPEELIDMINIPKDVLDSHRGWDAGAMALCESVSKNMKCTNLTGNYSRLLVDLNRSPKSKNLYSQYTKHFPLEWRRNILESYYLPYRKSVEEFITRHIDKREKILHLSIHSFTPELNGKIRDNDVGLLYDPARRGEKDISEKIKRDFLDKIPGLKIRKNYPYFGTSDGFTSWLRKEYNMKQYLGIEIEMNQKLYFDKSEKYEQLKMNLPEIIKNIARAV